MKRYPAWLSLAEQESLLEACTKFAEYDGNDWLYYIVGFALNVDMNKEQILSLTWDEVNPLRGTVSVSKGGCTVIIFLNPEAFTILQQREATALGRFVFSKDEAGEALEVATLDNAFNYAIQLAGLGGVCFEDLRKTHIAKQMAFSVYGLMEDSDLNDDEICDVFGATDFHQYWESQKRKTSLK